MIPLGTRQQCMLIASFQVLQLYCMSAGQALCDSQSMFEPDAMQSHHSQVQKDINRGVLEVSTLLPRCSS